MEINNSIPQNQPPKSQEDQKTGQLEQRATPEQSASGSSGKESLVLSDKAQSIQKATADIANQPVVDMERVEQVRKKLEQGTLDLFAGGQKSEESSLRIAEKMLQIDAQLESSNEDHD